VTSDENLIQEQQQQLMWSISNLRKTHRSSLLTVATITTTTTTTTTWGWRA
jgi:hypothetical protein